jgi:acetyl esterase/lipase
MASKELDKVLDILRANAARPRGTLDEQRAFMDAKAFPRPDYATYENIDAGGVPAQWVRAPESSEDRVVCYLHGGGYVVGSLKSHEGLAARIAKAAQATVLNIDYRLAPEHPFPAAVEDATAAYRWVLDQGLDAARVVMGGDSAGGGLTVAAMVSLRDAGILLPAAGVCLSPWVDLECIGDSMSSNAEVDPTVTREKLTEMTQTYLGDADPRSPLAAPLYADLAGLPPLLIQVGSIETLLDDSTRLHECAARAGVDSTFESSDDMFHVWHHFASMLPEAQEAIDRAGEYILSRVP